MKLFWLPMLIATTSYSQSSFITKGFAQYKDPSINEKTYLGVPNFSYFIPLTTNLRKRFLFGLTPTPLGRNGIRYLQNADMYTFRAIYSGLAGSVEYLFGQKRQYSLGLTTGYDLNWNFKEKYFKDSRRSEKTIIYRGSGDGRINTSSYSCSLFLNLFGVRVFYTYQPQYFMNNSYSSDGQYPYKVFPASRAKAGIGINLQAPRGNANQGVSK